MRATVALRGAWEFTGPCDCLSLRAVLYWYRTGVRFESGARVFSDGLREELREIDRDKDL